MAEKAPLVLGSDGLPQQLQAGDTLTLATSGKSFRVMTNGESSAALVIGAPVYVNAADSVKRAQANAKATTGAFGLVYDASISAGGTGYIQTDGVVVATTTQWDAVTGQTGGLTFNSLYFVDAASPGKLTATAPSTPGQCVTVVGRALSTTELSLILQPPILL